MFSFCLEKTIITFENIIKCYNYKTGKYSPNDVLVFDCFSIYMLLKKQIFLHKAYQKHFDSVDKTKMKSPISLEDSISMLKDLSLLLSMLISFIENFDENGQTIFKIILDEYPKI